MTTLLLSHTIITESKKSSNQEFGIFRQKFFEALRFADEAECIIRGNELVIRPAPTNSGGEFAEEILTELIANGLSGEELLKEFKSRQSKIRPAIEEIISEADEVASGRGEYYTYDDIFSSED